MPECPHCDKDLMPWEVGPHTRACGLERLNGILRRLSAERRQSHDEEYRSVVAALRGLGINPDQNRRDET